MRNRPRQIKGALRVDEPGKSALSTLLPMAEDRSVSVKLVDKLQQRIESLEALGQAILNRPASTPNEQNPVSPPDAPVLPCSPPTAQPVNARRSPSNDITLAPVISRAPRQNLPLPPAVNPKSPRGARGESPTFYGATSHPHVASPSEDSRLTSSDRVDPVGIELDAHSPRLRDHILRSFFKSQTLWVDIVNKDAFLSHQAAGKDSRWYSKFLENAMLACGTRLSTSASVRALGAKYFDWAKDEALKAMIEPTPANLQGFLLLSEYEVTKGNDRPGWMFCGVACRMLSDLGLHELAHVLSPTRKIQAPNKESDLAYALLSACIIYEGVWTLYLGRPSSIPASVMNTAAARARVGQPSDSPWLNAWVGLCVPMAQVSHVLNEESISDSDRHDLLRGLLGQVEDWYKNLPSEMTYDENRLTNMELAGYGLHTQYCKVQILLRQALAKPQNTKKRRHSQITNDMDFQASADESKALIYHYALRTARLVVTYREVFGTEKIPSIMLDNAVVAATTMIRYLTEAGNAHEMRSQVTWLRQLIRSMELVHMHFPIVGRMLDSLRQICGSGPFRSMVLSPHAGSTEAFSHQPQVVSQSLDLDSMSHNTIDDPFAFGLDSDMLWDFFDTNSVADLFSSGRVGDSHLSLPSSSATISNFAQAVP
ncbi:hypothetical protein NX059_005134 [Plenodomus lindquistii]|nr:hypothetical protein NX059_005134 [Plenodomus lindquistii]